MFNTDGGRGNGGSATQNPGYSPPRHDVHQLTAIRRRGLQVAVEPGDVDGDVAKAVGPEGLVQSGFKGRCSKRAGCSASDGHSGCSGEIGHHHADQSKARCRVFELDVRAAARYRQLNRLNQLARLQRGGAQTQEEVSEGDTEIDV